MKKIIKTTCLTLIILLSFSSIGTAMAQTPPPAAPEVENDTLVDESITQIDCFNGKENFGSFLRSLVSFDDFTAFFLDIQMNACQYTSVKILKDDLSSLREKIRDSYYTCDDHTATNLRLEYNRKEAELFFLRNLISTKKNERVATELSTLKDKMFQRFVKKKKYFLEKPQEGATKETFNEIWIQISTKYDARAFLECKGDIQLIQDKIEGLRDTIDGITAEFQRDKAQLEEAKETKNDNQGNKNASAAELKLNALNIFARSINQVSPQRFASDIIREFEQYTPSQLELHELLAAEQRRYEMDLKRAKQLARYKAKYQHTSDSISSDYSERIDTVILTLDNASVNMNDAKGCLEFVNETQCSE